LVSTLFEAGKVYFPQNASCLEALEEELLAFPSGAHDDQVGSMTQFLLWAGSKRELEASLRRI